MNKGSLQVEAALVPVKCLNRAIKSNAFVRYVRHGSFKAHFRTRSGYGASKAEAHDPPLLYDLEHDPGEKHDVAAAHLDVIERIRAIAARHRRTLEPVPNQLERR